MAPIKKKKKKERFLCILFEEIPMQGKKGIYFVGFCIVLSSEKYFSISFLKLIESLSDITIEQEG